MTTKRRGGNTTTKAAPKKYKDFSGAGSHADLKNVVIQTKHLPVEIISVDPEQPRMKLFKLGITPQSIQDHLARKIDLLSDDHPKRAKAFKGIIELAATIKQLGLIHAINVYQTAAAPAARYIVGEGERRYLAHIYLQKPTVLAKIEPHNVDPSAKFLRQMIENLQRDALENWEFISSIQRLDKEYQQKHSKKWSATALAEKLGKSRQYATEILAIARAPGDVIAALTNDSISTLEAAYIISRVDDVAQREHLVGLAKSGATTKELMAEKEQAIGEPATQTANPPAKKTRGRPVTKIALGSTTNIAVVKKIILSVLGEDRFNERFADVDWTSHKKTKNAWSAMLKDIEKDITQ